MKEVNMRYYVILIAVILGACVQRPNTVPTNPSAPVDVIEYKYEPVGDIGVEPVSCTPDDQPCDEAGCSTCVALDRSNPPTYGCAACDTVPAMYTAFCTNLRANGRKWAECGFE